MLDVELNGAETPKESLLLHEWWQAAAERAEFGE